MDSQTLDKLHEILGTDDKRGLGKHVQIQDDPYSSGFRIWYSAEDKLVAASYASYGSEDFIFEDEVYV